MESLPIILVAAVSALAGAAGTLALCRRAVAGRRRARLAERVAEAQEPAALSALSGRLAEVNAAMERLAGAGHATVESLLGAALERAGAPAIFRAATVARRHGQALLPVSLAGSGEARCLRATADAEGWLLWSIVEPERVAEAMPALLASPYETAPFAHMAQAGSEPPVLNARFRALFGADPAPVLAALPGEPPVEGERVLLTGRDGRVHVFRAFLDGPGGDGAERELFLFPVRHEPLGGSGPTRVLEMVPVALAQFETDGTLIWANGRARAILRAHAAPGSRLGDVFVPVGASEAGADDITPGAVGAGRMVQLRDADVFLQLSLTRVRLHDRETLLAVLTDASQLRQLEDQFAQSQKMEAVGKLAGGVAHDFNNVLTAIVGHCDLLLLSKDPSHPDYSDLMQIAQNANRAASLVRQLLAFSRKQTLKPEHLSLRDVVTETQYLLDRLLGETVRFELDLGAGLWPVRADHQQLEQVLMNLAVNARDAMDGVGTVRISARNRRLGTGREREGALPPGEYVELAVEDSGPGIPPSVIDKVFDPFFTTKAKGEGTGLGLSTVYGIVKQSGGSILAENAASGGARFRIVLPRAREDEEEEAGVAAPAARPRDLTGKGSVLLVEDEDPVRAFAARALRLRGYEVAEAATAEEAMELLEDAGRPVDLLVSDVVMPGMDGPTFAARARELRPGLRLVFISGYAEESFRKNLTEADFLFLPKPFSLNELTAKVKEALSEGVSRADG
jgi:two-component system cell cycle sensor histidine kinase/response regulator CckA